MPRDEIDMGTEYLGGMAKPAKTDVGKLAVVALDALGDPNLVYQTQTATVANEAFATTLAPHLRGLGLTVDSSGNLSTRVRPRKAPVQDYFSSGNNASGSIGALGWNLLGVATYARTNHTGLDSGFKADLSSGNDPNNRAVLCLGDIEGRTVVRPEEIEFMQFVVRIANTKVSVRHFLGFQSDFSEIPTAGVNALGLYFDSGVNANNWLTLARSANSGSPVDTGVAVALETSLLITLHRVNTTVNFYVGDTLVGSVVAGLPLNVAMNVGFKVQTLIAAQRTMRLGYFGFDARTLGGAFDDDTFLEV